MELIKIAKELSSRDISDVTGKRHDNVLKKINGILDKINDKEFIDLNFKVSEYKDSKGRSLPEISMTKSGSLFIASRYDVNVHLAVQKRWEELEVKKEPQLPQTKLEWMQLAVESEKQKQLAESKVQSLEEALDESEQWISIIRASKEYDVKETCFKWRVLKKYSLDNGIEIKTAPCPRFNTKKLYHVSVFKNCYKELTNK